MRLHEIDLKRGIGSRDIYLRIEKELVARIDEMYSSDICYEFSRMLPCGYVTYIFDMKDGRVLLDQSRFIDFESDKGMFGRFEGNIELYRDIWVYVWEKLNL